MFVTINDLQKDKIFITSLKEKNYNDFLEFKEDFDQRVEDFILQQDIYQYDDCNKITMGLSIGTGGDESRLFVEEMLNIYIKLFQYLKFKYNINKIGNGKIEIVVSGKHVFKMLKYESGVHRVQRIPTTEKKDRIHTSTISIYVLPFHEQKNVSLQKQDIKVDCFRAQGKGGQHVNKQIQRYV